MTTTTKVILGLVGAAAVGAAVGLLLAPEKGSDLRKDIKDKASKWTNRLNEMIHTGKDNLKSSAQKAASKMEAEI